MAAANAQLATALKAAKTKTMFFALIAKGLDGKLLVDKKKIPAKDIAEAKKECGGGTIFRGRCQTDDNGALVFEVAKEPPATLANTTKKIIKEQAGLTFKAIEFRMSADVEDEADEEQTQEPPAAPPTPPTTPDAASNRFARRLKLLAPLLQHALATGKPQAEQARTKLAEASAAFRARAADQANLLLDQAEPLIKQALTSAPPSSSADAQAWQQQLADIQPRFDRAVQGDAANAARLRVIMNYATGKADAGEFAKALAGLKQLTPFLDQASPTNGNAAFFKEWTAAKADLQVALDKVNKQLAQFAVAILETNEENLVWVAEEGLGQLMSALRDEAIAIDRATSKTPAKVAAKAKPILDRLRKQLQSTEVKACDDNQLGVSVTIRASIGKAIQQLEDTLKQANAS